MVKINYKCITDKGKNIIIYCALVFWGIFLKTNLLINTGNSLFDFSGIFIFLIIYIFGRKIGYLTSLIVIFIAIFMYNHSSFELIYILEAIFVFEIWNKKKINLIVLDIFFWLGFIVPIIALGNLMFSTVNNYEIYDLILIVISSLVNVFIVEIIGNYLIKANILKNKFKIELNDVIIHIIASIILIPFTINVYIDIFNNYNYIYKTNKDVAQDIKGAIGSAVHEWSDENILDLKLGSIISVQNLKKEIEKIISNKPHSIYITDRRNNELILQTGMEKVKGNYKVSNIDRNQYKIILSQTNNEKIGYNLDNNYILYADTFDNVGLNIFILTSMKVYKARIIEEHISQIKFLLLFIFFIFIVLFLLNKTVFKNLAKISESTKNLPNKIKFNKNIDWPTSGIHEVNLFIENIKSMSKEMKGTFNKLNYSQDKLYKLAYYDSLTNLGNRLSFTTHLEQLSEVKDIEFAAMLLDIDKFKSINDTLGHTVGDKLLIRVADKLRMFLSDKVSVYRIGGDEFTVLVNHKEKEKINEIANGICDVLKEKIEIDGRLLSIKCSLGISLYPKHSTKVENIIKFADIAMYESKSKDLGLPEFFYLEMMEKIDKRAFLEKKLRKAFKNNEIELFMQPKISSSGEFIRGYECLLRWIGIDKYKIRMEELISFAEESNIIYELDRWVLNEGCRINKCIQERVGILIPVSINISGKHFTQNNLFDVVKEALTKNNLKGEYLKIEVTESVLIDEVEKAISNIEKIKNLGVQISMDDFGKGYSSLTQLMKLPIDELKIDREFIRGVNKDIKKKNIVKLIVNTAKELGLNVVAEGVENEEEREFVVSCGCDEIQGYYYSKPLNEDCFNRYIEGERENNK